MTITVEFVGAAQTVTGSRHLVHTQHGTILLDCGLFQGRRQESTERNRELGFDPMKIHCVVLSHAHIDHSGALPLLAKQGYTGPIYTTPATRDLCAVMLEDAAMIQGADARYINRSIDKGKIEGDYITPLYDQDDVARVMRLMTSISYHRVMTIAEGVELTFIDAGHVLGSAITVLDIDDSGVKKRLVFTGDLGRHHLPILREPEVPKNVDALLMESTYGDRIHPAIERMDDELAEVLNRTFKRGGKVVIPSFALERAQEIIFSLKKLRLANRISHVPVYVDSPLTVNITQIFQLHRECFDDEARALIQAGESPFEFPGLQYISSVEDSMAIDRQEGPAVIISASGMCEAGRVLHHLKATVEEANNSVVIVGFQAQHTLGRRIVERRRRIRILGIERELRAEVSVLEGFSAHADQHDLVEFAENVRAHSDLRHLALVHGELAPQRTLASVLESRGVPDVRIPAPADKLSF